MGARAESEPRRRGTSSLGRFMILTAAVAAATALTSRMVRGPFREAPLVPLPGLPEGPTLAALLLASIALATAATTAMRRPSLDALLARLAATSALILAYFWIEDARRWLIACFAATVVLPLLARGALEEELRPGPAKDRALALAAALLASSVDIALSLFLFWVILLGIVLSR